MYGIIFDSFQKFKNPCDILFSVILFFWKKIMKKIWFVYFFARSVIFQNGWAKLKIYAKIANFIQEYINGNKFL